MLWNFKISGLKAFLKARLKKPVSFASIKPESIEISLATQRDLEKVVFAFVEGSQTDPLHDLIFPPGPDSTKIEINWIWITFSRQLLKNPRDFVVKALSKDKGSVIGVSVFSSFPDGRVGLELPEALCDIEGVNNVLHRDIRDAVRKMRERLLEGRPHCTLLFPQVPPQYQHEGVEEAMIRWALVQLGLEKETLWSYTDEPGKAEVFKRLGWTKADTTVLDLRRWETTEQRRSSVELTSFVREPGKLED